VGIVFLVHLLYYSQHPCRWPAPVNEVVLEALAKLREDCERQEVLLECPKILHQFASNGGFSVSVRATYATAYFDIFGHMVERRTNEPEAAHANSAGGVMARRLQVTNVDERASTTDADAVLVAQSGKELIDLGNAVREATEYEATRRALADVGSTCSSEETPQTIVGRLDRLKASAVMYQSGIVPEPRDLALQDGDRDNAGDDAIPVAELVPIQQEQVTSVCKRKRRTVVESASASDSGDSLADSSHRKGRNASHCRLVGLHKVLKRTDQRGLEAVARLPSDVTRRQPLMQDGGAPARRGLRLRTIGSNAGTVGTDAAATDLHHVAGAAATVVGTTAVEGKENEAGDDTRVVREDEVEHEEEVDEEEEEEQGTEEAKEAEEEGDDEREEKNENVEEVHKDSTTRKEMITDDEEEHSGEEGEEKEPQQQQWQLQQQQQQQKQKKQTKQQLLHSARQHQVHQPLIGKHVALLDAGNSSPADLEDDASVCDGGSTDATPTEPFMYKTNGEVEAYGGAPARAEDARGGDSASVRGSRDLPEPRRAEPAVEGDDVQVAPWDDTAVSEGPRLQLWGTKSAGTQEECGRERTDGSENEDDQDCDSDSDGDVVMGDADSG